MRRLLSRWVQVALDFIVLTGVFLTAYFLRFELHLKPAMEKALITQLPLVLLIQLASMTIAGVYTFIWRYVGLREVRAFFKAGLWSTVLLTAFRLFLPKGLAVWRIPLSIILMDGFFAFGGVLGLRVLRRILYERAGREGYKAEESDGTSSPVLLVGAGQAGVLAAKEIQGHGNTGLDIKGFLDDDPKKKGMVIQGIKVLGPVRDLRKLAAELAINQVIITIAKASRTDIRRIVDICETAGIHARIIPGLYEVLSGKIKVSDIRDVEIEDLLGRAPVHLREDEVAGFLRGRVVMVTGAGGSIGSEITRQVVRFSPSRLLLIERAEFVLFDIDGELRRQWPAQEIIPLVADVGDKTRMRFLMETYKPAVVFHAAAHKHVPMMETNPAEAIKNNIFGTWVSGKAAGEAGVEAFVLISTDKAVKPSSIMGASKRVAELVIQKLNACFATRYVAVRFGNVLGSAGSVVPIFHDQIKRGGPVTVTHPDMLRYFMTIPEASQLVLQAGAMGKGGEIFILDMGEPVRILDLAKDMITLSGLKPFEDIDIVFTGVRPGEKLFEELETAGENIAKTRHPKIFIGKISGYPPDRIERALERLCELAAEGNEDSIRVFLNDFLPEARLRV